MAAKVLKKHSKKSSKAKALRNRKALLHRIIGHGATSGIMFHSLTVIKNRADWNALLKRLNTKSPMRKCKISFSKEIVIVVFAGSSGQTAYMVRVTKVQEAKKQVNVRYAVAGPHQEFRGGPLTAAVFNAIAVSRSRKSVCP